MTALTIATTLELERAERERLLAETAEEQRRQAARTEAELDQVRQQIAQGAAEGRSAQFAALVIENAAAAADSEAAAGALRAALDAALATLQTVETAPIRRALDEANRATRAQERQVSSAARQVVQFIAADAEALDEAQRARYSSVERTARFALLRAPIPVKRELDAWAAAAEKGSREALLRAVLLALIVDKDYLATWDKLRAATPAQAQDEEA